MQVIGLTGGISSGKSTVVKEFLEAGVTVLDADEIVRGLQKPGSPLLGQLAATFGTEIFHEDGSLNRPALGRLIFNDEQAKQKLNDLIHPLVKKELLDGIEKARQRQEKIIILDVPLLYETGFHSLVDYVIVVYVPRHVQVQRLMERDQIDLGYAQAKIDSQGSLEEKRERADFVIDNSGSLETLKSKIKDIYSRLLYLGGE
jgi:dephospho-CoA kinase